MLDLNLMLNMNNSEQVVEAVAAALFMRRAEPHLTDAAVAALALECRRVARGYVSCIAAEVAAEVAPPGDPDPAS